MAGALVVVGAGAGSGKTTKICNVAVDKIVAGLDPAGVLATTFTRKAAAELKGRIQTRILAESSLSLAERVEKSERLEFATIGTVHSVGLAFLRRFAIPMGISPRLEVLEEEGQERHLRSLLEEMPPDDWEELEQVASRMGHTEIHDLVLDLLEAKRGNAIEDEVFRQQLAVGAERLCQVLSSQGLDLEKADFERFYREATSALVAIRACRDETRVTAKAADKLQTLVDGHRCVWQDYVIAAKLKAGRRSGADSCLTTVRGMASHVRHFQELHQDIHTFVNLLVERTVDLQRAYAQYKEERGLLDYTDLEVLFLILLEREDLEPSLRQQCQLVLVDEFQDTNPIQLAIFERLRRLAKESFWVGDEKQAIYGFRGTDSHLMRRVWEAVPDSAKERLPKNYRSQTGLVDLVGTLFEPLPLFGSAVRLEGHRAAEARGIERWLLEVRNSQQEAETIALGIQELCQEGVPLREIAILTRTNRKAAELAAALASLGLAASLSLPGLLSGREGALLLAGLRLVADWRDGLAAATLLHLLSPSGDETPQWLEERLRMLNDGNDNEKSIPWPDHPVLSRLRSIDADNLSPSEAVYAVMSALELAGFLPTWGEPSRRAQNLDALEALARKYEESSLEVGLSATLTGLITQLEGLARSKEDLQPAPRGTDAVSVLTYHSAKGLQWPVVVLSDLDHERDPDMWKPVVRGGDVVGSRPLKGRTLRYWPWPFGFDRSRYRRRLGGSRLQEDALATPEGKNALVLEKEEAERLLYVGFTRARKKLVLAHRPGKTAWLDLLADVDKVLPADLGPGEHQLSNLSTSLVLRQFSPPNEETEQIVDETCLWLQTSRRQTVEHPERFHAPSSTKIDPTGCVTEAIPLPGEHPFPARLRPEKETGVGHAVHAYLAALPSLRFASSKLKRDVAARCLRGFSVEGELTPEAVVAAGERLATWLDDRWPEAAWHGEVPILGTREAGGFWAGSIDLLLITKEGQSVVVDHKTAPVPSVVWNKVAKKHAGQLFAYREALGSMDLSVLEQWIHLAIGGGMVRVQAER